MSQRTYRIYEGSLQEQFFALRKKVQVYAGGFGNGKTAAAVVRALELARDYPGSNGLIARSTYPKLNDTIRKEFLKWCPKHWIKSFPMSANASNTCTLTNGTTINFRYIEQQGSSGGEASTSNLLSATYDWIIVDQVEDPEIVHKDFIDLLGRLRGSTPYRGNDRTMPDTGPRWMILTANPTRNWFYKEIIKPIHTYEQTGRIEPELLCDRDAETEAPQLDEQGKPIILVGIVEGSTYENKENLPPDFIKTLEGTYRGAMRERFLMGGWAAYEGLVYPQYSDITHVVSYDDTMDYLYDMQKQHYEVSWSEAYDFGIAVPSCYLMAFTDAWGNVFLFDGFYRKEYEVEDQRDHIKKLRAEYGLPTNGAILADPQIFRRTSASKRTIGRSTVDLFWDGGDGVRMVRGNNDILNGIIKVTQYLAMKKLHPHPLTGEYGAPHLYVCDNLDFVQTEFSTYMWNINAKGEREDKPRDKDDHAMDAVKYLLSRRPEIAELPRHVVPKIPSHMTWREAAPQPGVEKRQRYG